MAGLDFKNIFETKGYMISSDYPTQSINFFWFGLVKFGLVKEFTYFLPS